MRCSTADSRSSSSSPTGRAAQLQIAAAHGVAAELVERTDFSPDFDRVAYTHDVVDALKRHDVDLVAIAGFGTILSKPFVDTYSGRAVNTHPALLPSFKGWHAVRDALEFGVKVTGTTVHLVTEDVDAGPILAQEAVPVLDDDTEATPARAHQGSRTPPVSRRHRKVDARDMNTKMRRALVSVYDKTGLVEVAQGLHELGVEIVSSGNTSAALEAEGIPVTRVEDVTASPEMLDGRVKTLHPKIHGGLLADLGNETHRTDLDLHGILPFELVVSNLYPFEQNPDIETIDIGGPAMTRAAAKNHAWVTIVTSPDQYGPLLTELRANDGTREHRTRAGRFALDRVRAHRRLRRRDRAVARKLTRRCPSTSSSRSNAPRRRLALRRESAPARRALPPRRDDELVGRCRAARRPCALVPQLLRRGRGLEARP